MGQQVIHWIRIWIINIHYNYSVMDRGILINIFGNLMYHNYVTCFMSMYLVFLINFCGKHLLSRNHILLIKNKLKYIIIHNHLNFVVAK